MRLSEPSFQHRAARWLPALVFLLGAVLALASAAWLDARTRADAQAAFDRIVAREVAEIANRFLRPIDGLNGARGLYATHARVSRETFRRYVATLNMRMHFGGVRGFGFIQRVPRGELDAFVASERADGAPGFALRQLERRDEGDLFVIKNIEPAVNNQGALGLDVGSEPLRRAAALQALASGVPTVTGTITLVQDQRRSPGVLLFVPLVPEGPVPEDFRASAAPGLLYAPIVVGELLSDLSDVVSGMARVELFDSSSGTATGPLMHDSAPRGTPDVASDTAPHAPRYQAYTLVDLPGRQATLRVSSTPAFENGFSRLGVVLVAGLGLLVSALLASLMARQVLGRQEAEELARRMTADLSRLALVARRTSNAVVITDAERRIVWVNDGFERMSGYSADEVRGRLPGSLLQFEGTDPQTIASLRAALNARQGFRGEILNRGRHGRCYWLDIDIQPLVDDAGNLTGFMAVESDITERKTAEAALRASQAFLDQTGRIGGVGGWMVDLATRRLWWTAETCRMLDLEPGHEPSLQELADLCAPEGRESWLSAVDGALERGQGFDLALPMRTRTGRAIWVRAVCEVETGLHATPRLVGAMQDITNRRALELEVKRQGDVLRGAIDAIDEAFVLYDPQDRLVWCNERYRQTYAGVAPLMEPGVLFEDLIRAGALRGDYAEAVGRVEAWVGERMARHYAADNAVTQHLSNGRVLRIIERRLADGHTVGFRIDITDLARATSQAEAASAEAARALARLQAIYDILPVGITITDPAGNNIDCNPAAEQILDISKAEYLSAGLDERDWHFLREDGTPLPRAESPSVRALTEGRAVHDEVICMRTPRRQVWLSVSAMPVPHQDLGVVIGYVDVTEQRALRLALIEAKSLAEQASTAKSQFLANMSHEIRTPMNAILGMLALLKRTTLNPRQSDYADKTENAARSLLGLLNDILDFSKVEAGKLTLDPQPFAMEPLLRDLAVVLSANVTGKPVEVLFDIDPALPPRLVGDAMRLQQVLVNLSGNAAKFTRQGEVVLSMRVLWREAERVAIEIAVRDTGIGIAPEHRERIFSGFTQAEASTTRRYGGTGLGLAICQHLVGMMGGQITLDSEPGVGSCFRFTLTLPVAVEPDVPAEVTTTAAGLLQADGQPAAPAGPPHGSWHALVVDDNATARDLLCSMCESLGWTAESVDGGDAALALLRARRPAGLPPIDTVLLDWRMQGLDGWQTATRIRAERLVRQPLIVMVTAHGREAVEQRAEADETVLDGLLVKPLTAAMLAEAVTQGRARRAGTPRLPAPAPAARVRRLAGLRLLLAEDNPNNQQVACELLQEEGAQVQIVADGVSCVACVGDSLGAIDAVLMDLQMPVMGGLEAALQIRRLPGAADLPIVAMTANAQASDREACLRAGMNDHIGKPFDIDRLVKVLLALTGGRVARPAVPRQASASAAARESPAAAAHPQETPGVIAAAQAAGVDLSLAIRRMGGNPAAYLRALRRLIDELPAQAEAFHRAISALAAGDGQDATAQAARCLHALRGVLATIGMAELAATLLRTESALVVGTASPVACAHTTRVLRELPDRLKPLAAELDEAQGAAPPGVAVMAAREVPQAGTWRRAVEELATLLEIGDMRAIEVLPPLRSAPGAPPVLAALDDLVQRLDFERALAMCRDVEAEWAT